MQNIGLAYTRICGISFQLATVQVTAFDVDSIPLLVTQHSMSLACNFCYLPRSASVWHHGHRASCNDRHLGTATRGRSDKGLGCRGADRLQIPIEMSVTVRSRCPSSLRLEHQAWL